MAYQGLVRLPARKPSAPQSASLAPSRLSAAPATTHAGDGDRAARLGHSFGDVAVHRSAPEPTAPIQAKQAIRERSRENRTGMPDHVKAGIERLSGMPLDDVRVHYHSARPAQLKAHAYTQGTEIHVAPGQERHLAHEAWHVVQQKQGRVRPTLKLRGKGVNDDAGLEQEAEAMGARALRQGGARSGSQARPAESARAASSTGTEAAAPVQRVATKPKGRRQRATNPRTPRKPRASRGKYRLGQHGRKKQEQQRLKALLGITVTGDTHESEHTIGFEPLNQTSGLKRGTAGRARELENSAPAYQEMKLLHRAHIGTGTHGTRDESGFNSQEYRDSQRSLVESGDVSSAVQINQLGYAFDKNFRTLRSTPGMKAANQSYDTMVENMESVTYAHNDMDVEVPVDAKARAEMYLARIAARTGKFPSVEEENEARKKFGLDPVKSK